MDIGDIGGYWGILKDIDRFYPVFFIAEKGLRKGF
jgi:hypothetical protein